MKVFSKVFVTLVFVLTSLNVSAQNRIQLEYEDESLIELSFFEEDVQLYVKLEENLHNYKTSETYGSDPENLMSLTRSLIVRDSKTDDKVEIKFWISKDLTRTQITSIRL